MGSARAPLSPFVLVKGAGEMGSAIAWRLHMANMGRICMLDLENPLCVRRRVSYCTALETGLAWGDASFPFTLSPDVEEAFDDNPFFEGNDTDLISNTGDNFSIPTYD